MSHAANLRKYRPQNPLVPSKRRRLSPASSAAPLKPNGVSSLAQPPLSDTKLSAVPSQDAKKTAKSRHAESGVTVLQPEGRRDVDSSASSSASEDESDSNDSGSDESDSGQEDSGKDDTRNLAQSSKDSQGSSDSQDESDAPLTDNNPKTASQARTSNRAAESDEPQDEPSFADLLRDRAPETITIEAAAPESAATSTSLIGPSTSKTLTIPSANSLGTVLTQALKTNDIDLLESCLHVPNLESIRATIERIHPAHATTLLQKLAERLHNRPGRAGSLMVWVQWTVVAHGGYLASQPAAMKELRTLYHVVKQRASGLQPLLALKGKLDMLEAQMQLRRNMQAQSRAARQDEEDEGVIYVEGQERSSDDSEDERGTAKTKDKSKGRTQSSTTRLVASSNEDSVDETVPASLPNGVGSSDADHDDEDDEDEDDSDEEDGSLIDDEAEDTDNDSGDDLSDEIDYDDVDGVNNDVSGSEEEDIEPPNKRTKPSKTPSSRRR